MSGTFNVEETATAAMARPVGPEQRRHGVHFRWPTDTEIDRDLADYERYRIDDPGMSREEESRADWEDAHAGRFYDEPEDRTLTGEVPAGLDARCFGTEEW